MASYASYESIPVDDRTDEHFYYAAVTVKKGNDLIILDTEDADNSIETRMTIQEATALIEALQEAIRTAFVNRE